MIDWFQLLYLKTSPLERWIVYLLALTVELTPEEFQATAVRLALVEQNRHKLCEARQKGDEVLAILQRHAARRRPLANSDLYRLLHDLSMEVILHLMARTTLDDVRRSISTFVTHLRQVTCLLTGRDLKKMGVPVGPLYARILEEIKAARLNGHAVSREDEVRIVERVWRREEGRSGRKSGKPS